MTMRAIRGTTISVLAVAAVLSASAARADDTPPAPAKPPVPADPAQATVPPQGDQTAQADTGLQDIVVTANRRVESQQRVPIVISAFTADTIQTLNVQSTTDLPQITPGLSFTRTLAGANAFLRGVGTTNSGYTTEAPIATYVDGLYLPNTAAAAFSFNNIERIEVLKGPQGTLYGRNTTGGLIHVITRDPSMTTSSVDASAAYETYDTLRLNFYGATPISDTLAANISATYTNQADGWGYNTFLGTDALTFKDFGVQAKLKWEPAAGTRVWLRGFYDRVETDQGNSATIFPGSVGIDGTRYLGRFRVASRFQPMVTQRMVAVSLRAEHDLPFATLSSITGYIDNRSPSFNVQNGIVGNPVAGQSAVYLVPLATAKTFSQELQLTSNSAGSAFQWILGAFYYRDDTMVRADVYGTCVGTVCAAAPLPTRTTGFQDTRSYSAYGEGTYSITPSTRVTLGLRYTSDTKSLEGSVVPLPGLPNSVATLPATVVTRPGAPFAGNATGIDTEVTFGKLTWKAVLAQDFTPDIHGYLSWNRGFKSGGYNPISFINPPSRPEVLDAYEIGVKSELFDRMLRLNVGAFYYDYKDIQLRSTAPPAPAGGSILFNAASAHIKGIDADFVLAPMRGLTISGGAEYLDARYDRFPGGTCTAPRPIGGAVLGGVVSTPCNLSGFRPPSAPEWSYNLAVTYEFSTRVGDWALTANDGYKSRYFWEPDNRIAQDSFHLINATLTWTAPDPRYSVQLFVKNLADEYYFASASEGTAGNDVYVAAAPRTYGVTARYRF